MAKYDYECTRCGLIEEKVHGMTEDPEILCGSLKGEKKCEGRMEKVFLTVPQMVLPPHMQAAGDKIKYYGITDFKTGKGITKDTDVRDPPGITPKNKNRQANVAYRRGRKDK